MQSIFVITLGITDIPKSRNFYANGFDWTPVFENSAARAMLAILRSVTHRQASLGRDQHVVTTPFDRGNQDAFRCPSE